MKWEDESSIRGKIMREMIRHLTSLEGVGKKLQDGTLRQNLVEPPWQVPNKFFRTIIEQQNYSMDWIQSEKGNHHRAVLQLHGGGYVSGMRNIYRTFAVYYSKFYGDCDVLVPDYRVAPEHPFPAALEDAVDAYNWLILNGYEVVIAGDSAGGGLALALGHYLMEHHKPMPKAFVLMSAWTDLSLSGESIEEKYEIDPLFGNSRESMLFHSSYIGDEDPTQPLISPLFGDFFGFPPMLIQVGAYEMLLSDSERVAIKANEQGVKVQYTVYPGMFHDFQMGMNLMKESKEAWKEVKEFLKVILKTQSPV